MSWQEYVDKNLIGSGVCSRAAIIGLDGSTLATSPGFSVPKGEVKDFAEGFEDATSFLARGVTVAGTKFMCLKADEDSCFGKRGGEACVLAKTNRTFLVGLCDLDKVDIKESGAVVVKLAQYLVTQNC